MAILLGPPRVCHSCEAKEEDVGVTPALAPTISVSDAEQPEVEPACEPTRRLEPLGQMGAKGVEYFEIGSDMDPEGSCASMDITPRTPGRYNLQPPSPITEHYVIGSDADDAEDAPLERGSEADGEDEDEDPFGAVSPESLGGPAKDEAREIDSTTYDCEMQSLALTHWNTVHGYEM